MLPAIEIVDSRVAGWRIKLADTVADNASSGKVVVGGKLTRITDIDPRLVGMALSRNGEVTDTGAGAAALGNPVRCVAWLANKLGSFGITLQAGRSCMSSAGAVTGPRSSGPVISSGWWTTSCHGKESRRAP